MAFLIERYRIVALALGLFAFALLFIAPLQLRSGPQLAAVIPSPYVYSFNSDGALNETARMEESTSPYWWVNSGGRLLTSGGLGSTMLGDASLLDRSRLAYSLSNSLDTDR